MSNEEEWRTLLAPLRSAVDLDAWFVGVASRLLNGCCVVAGDQPHRIVEVEVYFHSADHPDPFAHCDPIQVHPGHWYFHRSFGAYRAGSFKGLDLTCGAAGAFGGVLIRGLETDDGTLFDGPSLCVDRLLAVTGHRTVAALDAAIQEQPDGGPLLFLKAHVDGAKRQVFRTARIGLSFKRHLPVAPASDFILRPYRFLTEPRRTAKGKLHLVLALRQAGHSIGTIREITGSPSGAIQRYISDFEDGKTEISLAEYGGKDLNARDLCRLHGTLAALGLG